MKAAFEHNTQSHAIDLTPDGSGRSYRVTMEDQKADVEILQAEEGRLILLVDGQRVVAYISSDRARRWVTINGRTLVFTKASGSHKNRGGHAHAAGELTAPMPGQVRAVNVGEGERVSRGQTLLLLEAMKMEIRIQAAQDGVVGKLFVRQGQTVEKDQALVEIREN
ncbi:MAG: biotin/lipoyl-containing protein [Bacteroidota bacterium]